MKKSVIPLRQGRRPSIDSGAVLSSVAAIVTVVDHNGTVLFLNDAAEQFFCGSAEHLTGQPLTELVAEDSPLFGLVRQVASENHPVAEYHVALASPRIGSRLVNIQASPLADRPGAVVLSMHERSIAAKIDRQLSHRGAARSVSALASMLAHEVKNPIAGIRGAAQLLEQSAAPSDRPLTQLIRDEADRICALIDRMEVFAAGRPFQREAVNIHEVLSRVRMLAENGFGPDLRYAEMYDPSLPPVYGNRDQLMQVFLNLAKNAVEAAPPSGGEIVISTRYQHGVRLAAPASNTRMHLPLMVSVQDNGEGIPEDLRPYLFDPFVSSKPKGSGLGLALVAKIIGEHGGVIEFDSRPKRTVFRVMLPMVPHAGETT